MDNNMYVIVGLGNPNREYVATRHNIGFEVIAKIAHENNIYMDFKKHKALCGKGYIEGHKVILAQPQTYMNRSGESVRELVDYYKISKEELIVIYDDISLDIGQIRIRKKGSAGGHNGIKNIIQHLAIQEFPRIKVGVGDKPRGWDLADYVLSRFRESEIEEVSESIDRSARACKLIIAKGIEAAMNQYNKKAQENSD
jgi:peptidyl-tRNA hydrolase, PTH1 family